MFMGDTEKEGVCVCLCVNVCVFWQVFCFLQQGRKSLTVTSSSVHREKRGPSVCPHDGGFDILFLQA